MTGWRVLKPKTTALLDLKAYCMMQNGQAGYSYTDRSAPRLDGPVDLYTGPQAKRANLEICRRPDGTLWLLGEGACGKVYKVRRTQTTDRQQTQTDNRQTTDTPVLKVYTTITLHVWQRVAPSTAVHAQAGAQTLPWNAYFAPVSLGSMESEQDATDKIKQMYHLSVVSQRCHVG